MKRHIRTLFRGLAERLDDLETQIIEAGIEAPRPNALEIVRHMRMRVSDIQVGNVAWSAEQYAELTTGIYSLRHILDSLKIPRSMKSIRSTPKRRQTLNAFFIETTSSIDRLLHALSLNFGEMDLPTLLPGQGPGPHFSIDNGQIGFAGRNEFDHQRNNVRRLESLLPLLRDESARAIKAFGGNMVHARVHDALVRYQNELSGTVETLNYELIAAYGLLLANEESASKRDIEDRIRPSFEDDQLSSLKTVLDLHGPFILATEAGRSMIEDATSFYKTEEQEREFKKSAIDLASAIADEGIAKPAAGEFLVDAANNIAVGPQPDRSTRLGGNAIRNAVTAVIGGALISYPLAAGYAGPMAAYIAVLIAGEGIKKSMLGQAAAEVIKDAVDDPSQKRNFARLADFSLANEEHLRRLAGDRREFTWVHEWLSWMKKQSDSNHDL